MSTVMNAKPSALVQRGASRILLLTGGALLALLVIFAAVYGPQLLAYYRFGQAIEAIAHREAASGGRWPQVQEACIVCHGFNGNTVTQLYPRLAGQPAVYMTQQLKAFASGQRANPTMSPLAMSLSAEEVQHLAEYFAAQVPAHNTEFVADPPAVAKGEALVKAGNCAACHGAELSGQAGFPRLAGQGYSYLVDQLHAFRNGKRKDPSGAMNGFSATFSDDDIASLAHYLASRR